MFGGIDTSKFVGPLHALPLAQQYTLLEDGFYRYWIDVKFIGITTPGTCTTIPLTNSSFSARFLPDTGTTLTYMPEDIFYALLDYFPDATPQASYGYVVDCAHLQDQGSIDFGFGEFTIHVPIREFVFQVPPTFAGDIQEMVCVVGAVPVTDFFILGDTFLRSVVGKSSARFGESSANSPALFRQQEHKVYLAQYMNCGVNIIQTSGNMSGMLGDCGHREAPFVSAKRNEKAEEGQDFMTCATYLTGEYTPISSMPSTSEVFANGLFPRPAMQTVNSRQGPPKASVTATATMERRQNGHVNIVKTTSLVTRGALTLAGYTTLSATTEVLTLTQPVPDQDMAAGTTTECVTATATEWVGASAVSISSGEYPSSSDGSSTSHDSSSGSSCTSKHHHHKMTATCDETTSFPDWPSSSISTAIKSYMSEVPKAMITIPVQTDETVIVKLKTTTYTIIDGVSQSAGFVPESSTTNWDSSVLGTGGSPVKPTGGMFTNSSVVTGSTSTESSSPLSPWLDWSTEAATTTTHTGWSTTVSGEPDGLVTELSWTPDAGATSTESMPPWVTELVKRGVEGCGCELGDWWCRCQPERAG